MPKFVRAYQLRSRAARTSDDDTEKSGSETSKYGTSDVVAMRPIVIAMHNRRLAPAIHRLPSRP